MQYVIKTRWAIATVICASAISASILLRDDKAEEGHKVDDSMHVSDAQLAARREIASGSSIGYEELDVENYNNDSWFENGLRQEYLPIAFEDLRIVESIRNPSTGVWNSIEYRESSTFELTHVQSSGKDYWYLAGIDSADNIVFEQWRLKRNKFSLPGQPALKSIKKMEVFRGPCESIIDFHVDPERRFLLALGRNATGIQSLYQLPIAQNSTPILLLDGISLPDLNASDYIAKFQHALLGRIWVIENEDPGQSPAGVIVLTDSNNDGIFDFPPIVGDGLTLYYSGIIAPSQYVDTFMGDD